MAKAPISVTGKKLNLSGTINVDTMELEVEDYCEPVSIAKVIGKEDLNGKFVKITIAESDKEIAEAEIQE